MPNESDPSWATIRDALPVTGRTVVDVTCDDWEDVCAEQPDPSMRTSKVYLHFDDGATLGFFVNEDRGFCYDGHPD